MTDVTAETKQESAVRRITALFEDYKREAHGGNEDQQTNFADLLADLMHFAKASQADEDSAIDFAAALSTASGYFSEENDGEVDDEGDFTFEFDYGLHVNGDAESKVSASHLEEGDTFNDPAYDAPGEWHTVGLLWISGDTVNVNEDHPENGETK